MATINATARAASSLENSRLAITRRNGDGVADPKAEEHDADHEEGWTASVGEEEHAASQRLRNETVRRDGAPVRGARCAPPDGDAADDGSNARGAGGEPRALPSERGCEHRDEVGNKPGLREQGQSHSDAQRKKGAITEKGVESGAAAEVSTVAPERRTEAVERAAVGGLVQALRRPRQHEDCQHAERDEHRRAYHKCRGRGSRSCRSMRPRE